MYPGYKPIKVMLSQVQKKTLLNLAKGMKWFSLEEDRFGYSYILDRETGCGMFFKDGMDKLLNALPMSVYRQMSGSDYAIIANLYSAVKAQ